MLMSTSQTAFSPQRYARAGGAAYLVIIVTGLVGEMFIRDKLIVPGNRASTAANILSHPLLWRMVLALVLVLYFLAVNAW